MTFSCHTSRSSLSVSNVLCSWFMLLLRMDATIGIGKPIAEEPHTIPKDVVIDLMPTLTTPDPTTTTTPSAEATGSETAATNEATDATTATAD